MENSPYYPRLGQALDGIATILRRDLGLKQEETTLLLGQIQARLPIRSPQRQAETHCYRTVAGKYMRDGELEIDADAVVSVSPDGGAYVETWLWISHDELTNHLPSGTLTLETVNGRCGTEEYVAHESQVLGLGMSWDADGDDETGKAVFETNGDGSDRIELSGQKWRDLEQSGLTDELIAAALAGATTRDFVEQLLAKATSGSIPG